MLINKGIRRKLRKALGSRTARRSGTKRHGNKPVKQVKPIVRLEKKIKEYLETGEI